jgi:hypothetical protein
MALAIHRGRRCGVGAAAGPVVARRGRGRRAEPRQRVMRSPPSSFPESAPLPADRRSPPQPRPPNRTAATVTNSAPHLESRAFRAAPLGLILGRRALRHAPQDEAAGGLLRKPLRMRSSSPAKL